MSKNVKYKELWKNEHPNLEKFLEIYRKDKYLARVIFMDKYSGNGQQLWSDRLVYFEREDGYEFATFRRSWGISKTNKLYNRERKSSSYFKTKKGFFCKLGNKIRPLMYSHISESVHTEFMYKRFLKDFPPLELIKETGLMSFKSFDYIKRHKLTSLKKMMTWTYELPYPTAKKFYKQYKNNYGIYKTFKEFKDYVTNKENANKEFFTKNPTEHAHLFMDSLSMAKKLDKKINLNWSTKRLKLEHDKMSKELTEIIYTHLNEKLRIKSIYKEFAEFSGLKILTDTKSLALEGMRQSHCVAGYSGRVNNGQCAIYVVGDYTLDVGREWEHNTIVIRQFRGYRNKKAPQELYDTIQHVLDEFKKEKGVEEDVSKVSVINDDNLPF